MKAQATLPPTPAAMGLPRSAAGEYGHWSNGMNFSTAQMEWFQLRGRYAHIDAQFGVIELEGGGWLSNSWARGPLFPDRQTALMVAGDDVIARIRHLHAGSRWMIAAEANAIIAWVCSITGRQGEALLDDLPPVPVAVVAPPAAQMSLF